MDKVALKRRVGLKKAKKLNFRTQVIVCPKPEVRSPVQLSEATILQRKSEVYWLTAITPRSHDSQSIGTQLNFLLNPPLRPEGPDSLSADDFAVHFFREIESIRSVTSRAPPSVIHIRVTRSHTYFLVWNQWQARETSVRPTLATRSNTSADQTHHRWRNASYRSSVQHLRRVFSVAVRKRAAVEPVKKPTLEVSESNSRRPISDGAAEARKIRTPLAGHRSTILDAILNTSYNCHSYDISCDLCDDNFSDAVRWLSEVAKLNGEVCIGLLAAIWVRVYSIQPTASRTLNC